MNETTWSKQIVACANELATMIVSPLGTASGPSSAAAAMPATKVLFPFPRATDSAAVPAARGERPTHKPGLPGKHGERFLRRAAPG